MNYFNKDREALSFLKNFLERFFLNRDEDEYAISDVRSYFILAEESGSNVDEYKLKEALEYVLESTFEEDVLMDIMEESAGRSSYSDGHAKRFFKMVYETLFLGVDDVYDYYDPTEEELEAERVEEETEEQEEISEILSWAEGMSREELLVSINNPEHNIRYKSMYALYYRGEKCDSELVTRFENESEHYLKANIIKLLGDMKSELAFDFFVKHLKEQSNESSLRNSFFLALRELKDKRAISNLIDFYKLYEEDLIAISMALSVFGAESIDALMKQFIIKEIKPDLLKSVIMSSGKSTEISAVLLKYLEGDDLYIITHILDFLSFSCDKNSIEQVSDKVIPLLKCGNKEIRKLAAKSIWYFNSPQTIQALKEALNDSDEKVRDFAEMSLNICLGTSG